MFIFKDVTVTPNQFWLVTDYAVEQISYDECVALNKGLPTAAIPLDSTNIFRLQQAKDAIGRVRASLIADIADQVPLTVQGASEDFIENVMGQVVVNANTNANTVNANVVILRDQVKAHVTTEANRVIAAI